MNISPQEKTPLTPHWSCTNVPEICEKHVESFCQCTDMKCLTVQQQTLLHCCIQYTHRAQGQLMEQVESAGTSVNNSTVCAKNTVPNWFFFLFHLTKMCSWKASSCITSVTSWQRFSMFDPGRDPKWHLTYTTDKEPSTFPPQCNLILRMKLIQASSILSKKVFSAQTQMTFEPHKEQ